MASIEPHGKDPQGERRTLKKPIAYAGEVARAVWDIVHTPTMRYGEHLQVWEGPMKPIGLMLLAVSLLSTTSERTSAVADEVRPQRILIEADPQTNPANQVVYGLERERQWLEKCKRFSGFSNSRWT
jgi:hypothetical protein